MPVTSFTKEAFKNTSTRLLMLTFVGIVIIAGYIVANTYFSQLRIYEDNEYIKLETFANTIAVQLDGDAHEALMKKYPDKDDLIRYDQDSVYLSIYNVLKKAQARNHLNTDLYTMVLDDQDSTVYFGVSTSKNLFYRHIYEDRPDDLVKNYATGGFIPVYKDMYGVWLSAFSPIYNSSNKVVAVVQVDENFDDFIKKANRSIVRNIWISLVIIGLIGLIMYRGITIILNAEKDIQKEKRGIEGLRKELVANVSHDLRTPVAVIHGYTETMMLKHDELTDDQRQRYIQIILQNTEKLKKLINELFELSKLESKDRQIQAEPMQLSDLVQDIIAKFRLLAEEKGIRLTVNTGKNLPQVYADLALIDRVMQNLIENAIKFCGEGDEIEVELTAEQDRVRVIVSDTGPGIAPNDIPLIFERYHRGENAQKGSSTGLGLAIVKKIIDLHNSTIEVASTLGNGTEFRFYLPIYKG